MNGGFGRLVGDARVDREPAFAAVTLAPDAVTDAPNPSVMPDPAPVPEPERVEIVLRNGRRLLVGTGVDVEALARLVTMLEGHDRAAPGARVWLACGATDMRRGMPGLALLVQKGLGRDPHSGDLFVFRGKRGSLLSILWHDGVGMSLYAKRLEKGRFI